MSLGAEINELLGDIGTGFTILRDSGNISGEKLIYKVNRQVTKPFIRGYFLEIALNSATNAITGDILQFDATSDVYLTVTKTPRIFEGSIYDNQGVLYKCNVSGELLRLSGEGWDSDYQQSSSWTTVKDTAYGLLTEELYGTSLKQDEPAGQVATHALQLYIPKSYGVKYLDRYLISGETPFKVEEIDEHRFDDIVVAHLEIDTRE